MDYTTFKNEILKLLKESLPEEITVICEKIPKNNGIFLEGILLKKQEKNTSPILYVNEYYKLYQKGVPMEQLVEKILWNYEMYDSQMNLSGEFFRQYEPIKKHIFFNLVNYEKNKEYLKQVPHKRFLDLAVIFYYQMETMHSTATITIRNSHMKLWGIDFETLEENAKRYTYIEKPAEFLTIAQIAGVEEKEWEKMTGEDPVSMFILTNKQRNLGAGTILYPSIMQQAERLFQGDFFILPSSIHECILIPATGSYNQEELVEMVKDINQEHVSPEEFLADQAYYYLDEDDKIHM